MQKHAVTDLEDVGLFQIFILVLSFVVLVTLLIDTAMDLQPEVSAVIQLIDNAACVVLLIDFAIRFRSAKSKMKFMRLGWIDLIASIPTLDILRLGRLVRLLRVIRLLRGMRLTHRILSLLFRNRLKGGLATAALTVFLLLSFSSVSILICERSPDANILTAEDAIWWSLETMTTVGYGDRYPVTSEGRIVAMILMLSGLGLFGTISGIAASLFVGIPEEKDASDLEAEIDALREEIVSLKNLLKGQIGTLGGIAILNRTGAPEHGSPEVGVRLSCNHTPPLSE